MNRIACALLLGLAAAAAAQEDQRPSQAQPESNKATRRPTRFSRNLLISVDPRVMDLNATLSALQWGPLVAALPPELGQVGNVSLRTYGQVHPMDASAPITCMLMVEMDHEDPAAPLRATELLAEALQARLAREAHIRLAQKRESLAGALERLKLLETRRQALQEEISLCFLEGADRELGPEVARLWEQQREISGRLAEAEIDLAARRARLEALGQAIAQAAVQAREAGNPKNDHIALELQSILEARERALTRMKALHAQGQCSSEELEAGQSRLSEARIALLERREALARESGSLELLARLKGQQTELVLELAELETRLKATANHLKMLEEKRAQLEQQAAVQKTVDQKLQQLQQEFKETLHPYREAKAAAEQHARLVEEPPPPKVILLD